MEDRVDIHKDYPTGDYRRKNEVWDAAAGRVTLRAARNEFVAFQVVVEKTGAVDGPISVRLDSLRGPNGATITGKHVQLFKAWYMHVLKPSSGYRKTSLGPGWYADALIPAPEGKPGTYYFAIKTRDECNNQSGLSNVVTAKVDR